MNSYPTLKYRSSLISAVAPPFPTGHIHTSPGRPFVLSPPRSFNSRSAPGHDEKRISLLLLIFYFSLPANLQLHMVSSLLWFFLWTLGPLYDCPEESCVCLFFAGIPSYVLWHPSSPLHLVVVSVYLEAKIMSGCSFPSSSFGFSFLLRCIPPFSMPCSSGEDRVGPGWPQGYPRHPFASRFFLSALICLISEFLY